MVELKGERWEAETVVGAEPESAEGRSRPEVDRPEKPPGAGRGWVGIGCNEV